MSQGVSVYQLVQPIAGYLVVVIWIVVAFLIVLVALLFGFVGFAKRFGNAARSEGFSGLAEGSGKSFSTSQRAIPSKLTYTIPPAFERYCEQRDGWKRYLPWIAQLTIFSALGSLAISVMNLHTPTFGSFFIIFFGFGIMIFGMKAFTRNYDRSITFDRKGIGNLPKGGRTPYNCYAKVVIKTVQFETREFVVVNFISKRMSWQQIPAEYGFDTGENIEPLLVLLKEQGLTVEGTIGDAPATDLR